VSAPFVLDLDRLIEEIADRTAAKVIERQHGGAAGFPGWLDQHSSGLGPRRHNPLARRGLQLGKPGYVKLGRRYLISPEALALELGQASSASASQHAPEVSQVRARLEKKLALIRG
jgi:hypothetical protein